MSYNIPLFQPSFVDRELLDFAAAHGIDVSISISMAGNLNWHVDGAVGTSLWTVVSTAYLRRGIKKWRDLEQD